MRGELTPKERFIVWMEVIFFSVLAMLSAAIALALFATITVGVVMSGMWTASLFK